MSKLLVLAVLLLVSCIILRVALAMTGVFLHVLWIAAILLAVLWMVGKLRSSK